MDIYFEIAVTVLLALLLIVEFKRLQLAKSHNHTAAATPQTPAKEDKSVQPQKSTPVVASECEHLKDTIEEELSKLRRYNTYSLTLMEFSINLDAHKVSEKLKEFVRKSDRVHTCNNKLYLFFPFTRYNSSLKEKIENRVLTHLQGQFDKEVKFITTKFYGFKYDPELRDEEFPIIN